MYLHKVESSRIADVLQGKTQSSHGMYWLTASQAEALGIELGTQKLTAHQLAQIEEFTSARELSDVEFTPKHVPDTRDLNHAEKQKIRYSTSPNNAKHNYK
ncbi:hypothetical protein FZX01_16375 [Listeria monocytogenes]|uniref:hypothetical protein n=1 Tax=Listeria monocytogenes TaxID=1639 RepID=UPI0012560B6C|nr:hypothetical protein [Listeria monocytogenes]TYU82096.1 hypothetical protein FZX01_16375 [Listeria monocytogenes]